MNLLDLLATRPVSRFYPHLQPKGTHTKFFDPATCSAEAYLHALTSEALSLHGLLTAARELYAWRYPWWRGLGNGFATATDVPPWDGRFVLWSLGVLGYGAWPMLEVFKANPIALIQELLTWWPPRLWADQADLLRLPQAVRDLLKEDRVEVGPVRYIDLRWLPRRMGCGLTLRGPMEARLPSHLSCAGPILIDSAGGIEQVEGLEAPDHSIRLKNLPDLRTVRLCSGSRHVVEGCAELRVIDGEMDQALVLRDLPKLEVVSVRAPDLAGRAADLTIEGCQRLTRIGWPNGPFRWIRNLALTDCPSLDVIPPRLRVTGTVTGRDCPGLIGRGVPDQGV